MHAFCLAYPNLVQPVRELNPRQEAEKLAQPGATFRSLARGSIEHLLGHNVALSEKLKSAPERLWYDNGRPLPDLLEIFLAVKRNNNVLVITPSYQLLYASK